MLPVVVISNNKYFLMIKIGKQIFDDKKMLSDDDEEKEKEGGKNWRPKYEHMDQGPKVIE